jgi:hypothetical protein
VSVRRNLEHTGNQYIYKFTQYLTYGTETGDVPNPFPSSLFLTSALQATDACKNSKKKVGGMDTLTPWS